MVADRDVGQIGQALAPAEADPHQLRLEGIEGGGFGIEGNRDGWIGCRPEALHQGL